MGLEIFNNVIICGNFAKVTKRRPRNWVDKDYKIIVPFRFGWRHKLGNVECNCNTCYEHYQPYYGYSWYHMEDCAILKHLEKHPGIANLNQYYGYDFSLIASTE